MSRSAITNPRKLARLSSIIGRPVFRASARGGMGHQVDAYVADGSIVHVYKDGTTALSDIRWHLNDDGVTIMMSGIP